MELKEHVKQLASTYFDEIVSIRRHIHQNPELSFNEFNTSKYICSELDNIGISYTTGYVKTGIVAHIEGKSKGKTIALRADIDALPIIEDNDCDYKSNNLGVMHACGHDAHTACLLGAARIVYNLKHLFSGTIKLIFQPAEEKLPGGASLMIKEGVLKNPDVNSIYGQHVFPDLEVGKIGFRKGMYMASADEIYVTVKGKGGHAALPHKNVDPILISAHLITALQQLVSRNAKPDIPSVLSFGKIIGNGATNIIPDVVQLEGTFRTFNEEWRTEAHQKMVHLAENLAKSMGGECDFRIEKGYPFLVNDELETERSIQHAKEFLGEENVIDLDLRMTAEDFAFYSQLVPSCFYRLGTRNTEKGITSGLHTSTFNIDEKSLEIGAGFMAYNAIKQLI